MNPTDIRDKMRRQPDRTVNLDTPLRVFRRGDTPKEDHMTTTTFEFDEADLIKVVATCITEKLRYQATEGVRLATGDPAALRRRGAELLMKGTPLYEIPQGVQDELRNWSTILGLSLTALADLLRNIQLGVIAESDEAPPSQAEECESLIGRSLAASPHDRSRNPLYCNVRHARMFSL